MRKNVASQKIGAQMITAADGSAFTGTVTVYVTGDAGSQALGSVGSGVCTHEGNGYHTYAPDQAETNYNLIAFTFIGSGAIPCTVQVFTVSYDPHDAVRLGLTALPNAAAAAAGGLPISAAGGLDLDTLLAYLDADISSRSDGTGVTLHADYNAAKTAAQAGDEMDLVDAPNSTAIAAIITAFFAKTGLTALGTETFAEIVRDIFAGARGKFAWNGTGWDFYDSNNSTILFTFTVTATGRTVA